MQGADRDGGEMQVIIRLSALALLLSLAVGCAAPQPKQVRLSWDPVTTNTRGQAIGDVRYEVYLQVNDQPERRFGPVAEPSIEIPVQLAPCDRVRAQVVSIRNGVRSGRSTLVEQRMPPAAEGPGCTQRSAARSCPPSADPAA